MQIAIIELPAEAGYKVKVDEQDTQSVIKKSVVNQRWQIYVPSGTADVKKVSQEPHSREAAAALAVYYHFERERRRIESKREESGAAS